MPLSRYNLKAVFHDGYDRGFLCLADFARVNPSGNLLTRSAPLLPGIGNRNFGIGAERNRLFLIVKPRFETPLLPALWG